MFIYSESQREEIAGTAENVDGPVDDELVLIGLEVDEGVGILSTSQFGNAVRFPQPRTTLNQGSKHVVLMPDSGLGGLYSDSRLEVYHAPEEIAKCFLASNYLAPAVFGRQADIDIRQEVFEYMGLNDVGVSDDEMAYREQLREIAGIDEPEVVEETANTRVEQLTTANKYGELQTMAKDLGIEDARQDKTTLAEYVAEHEDED